MTDHTDSTEPTDALAEVDRRGRRAAHALRTALAVAEPPPRRTADVVVDPVVDPVPRILTPPPAGHPADDDGPTLELARRVAAPRRLRRRLVVAGAAAAGVLAVGGIALTLGDDGEDPVESQGPAASVVPAPGDQGIRSADGGWNGFTIAGEGPGPGWQWTALVPALGTDLVFALQDDETRATYVMEDIGEDQLQVAATDLDGHLPGEQVAVYGVVTTGVKASGGAVTVEAPGADPVPLDVVELRGDPTAPGPTHDLVVGWAPPDVGTEADVVARDGDGAEVARVPLGWTGERVPLARTGPARSDGLDAPIGSGAEASAEVAEDGRNVVLSVSGYEDSADTVLTTTDGPLQVLATLLDGEGTGGVIVYGLVVPEATSLRLETVTGEPIDMEVLRVDGVSYGWFGAFVERDGLEGAAVVAEDAAGAEVARAPLGWTRHDTVVRPGTLPGG
jgi:hypothetical protein